MKDFSLHILDIAENAAKAGATLLTIRLKQQGNRLLCTIADNGCGMSETTLQHVTDPFYTTRTTRPVGMGLPLLRQTVEQTGGMLSIRSRPQQRYHSPRGCARDVGYTVAGASGNGYSFYAYCRPANCAVGHAADA